MEKRDKILETKMIKLMLTNDNKEVILNPCEISSVHSCRGSIEIFSAYSVVKMRNGDRFEVTASVDCIQNLIDKEEKL